MPAEPRPSRRAVLATGTAAASAAVLPLVAGCDIVDGAPTGGRRTGGEPSGDEELVAEAVAEVAAVMLLVNNVRERHPHLGPELTGLQRLHAAHAEALGAPWRSLAGPGRSGAPRAALDRVRRRELGHQRRLADLAVRAESGQLAQLLASMSAAVAQHVTALPREVRA